MPVSGSLPKHSEAIRAKVKAMWLDYYSAREIGAAVSPQMTRNAVIGLARRMGLARPRTRPPVLMADLKPDGCKYCTAESHDGHLFCRDKRDGQRPYCKKHASTCYSKQKPSPEDKGAAKKIERAVIKASGMNRIF